jgi:hypothetical protein
MTSWKTDITYKQSIACIESKIFQKQKMLDCFFFVTVISAQNVALLSQTSESHNKHDKDSMCPKTLLLPNQRE